MRRKRGNTNIKILQSQIQNIALNEAEDAKKQEIPKSRLPVEIKGSGAPISNIVDVPIVDKIKKKGIKKDELINTKRLLTM
jgi:predicted transcriptional regulator